MASSNAEHEFLEPSAKLKEFECPVCLFVTREPHLTGCCGQHFCQACINRIVTNRKPCPCCKAKRFIVILDKKQKRRVLELKVECTWKERGCDWSGELGKLDTHVDTRNGSCQFVDVNCPNNCGESHQRRHLANHLSDLCPKRPFTCQYCGQFKANYKKVYNDHYPKCTKYPVPCPNKCEVGSVERSNFTQHVSECPLQVVECEFAHAGCSEKITRTDLPKHMELSVQKHLVLVSSYCVKEMTNVRKELTEAKKKLAQTEKKLAEKDKQIKALQTKVHTLEVGTGFLPIEFTLANFSWYEGTGKRVEGPVLCTAPKIQIKFYFPPPSWPWWPQMEVEVYQLPGESDDRLNWCVQCFVHATLLNQSSDQHHISRSQDYTLSRPTAEQRKDAVLRVFYSTIKNHSQQDRQYLKYDNVKIRFFLKLFY